MITLKPTKMKFKDPITQKYVGINAISDESAVKVIHDFLDEHPELITTVQNNSITIEKLTRSLREDIEATKAAVSGPLVVTKAKDMTNKERIYVYIGEEPEYVKNNWYYHNGTKWVSGGVFPSTRVDTDMSLTVPYVPADAKATGEAIDALRDDTLDNQSFLAQLYESLTKLELASASHIVDWIIQDGVAYGINEDGEPITSPLEGIGGGGGGGGGGGSQTSQITVTNTSGFNAKTISQAEDAYITFNWSSYESDMPTGNGTLKIVVGGSVRQVSDIAQGEVQLNLKPFLTIGTNVIRLTVTDSYENTRFTVFTFTLVESSISTDLNTTQPFYQTVTYPYIPKGGERTEKVVHFLVDGVEIGIETVYDNNKRHRYTLPSMTQGAHSIEVYFEEKINDQIIESNHLYNEITYIENPNSTIPIISSSFNTSEVDQYDTVYIPFRVNTPAYANSAIEIYVNDGQTRTLVSSQTVDKTEQSFSYRANTPGSITISIVSAVMSNVSKDITFLVRESDIEISAVQDSLVLHLTADGRSNNESTRDKWSYKNINCTFSNFNWRTNGWLTDDDNVDVLRLNGDARVTIPYKIFENNFISTGKTIEIEFATRGVSDYSIPIISCMSNNTGLEITPQQIKFNAPSTPFSAMYKDNEHIRLTITVEEQTRDRLELIYINGIASRAVQYSEGEKFSQSPAVGITIGSNDCEVDIYNIRVYDIPLSMREVVNNWIADTADGKLMTERYRRNQIYDTHDRITPETAPKNCPYMILKSDSLPDHKATKAEAPMIIEGSFTDPVFPSFSFTFEGCEINVQGTSSAIYFRKNNDLKFKVGFITSKGTIANYGLTESSIPFNRFVLKADVASSESTNNTGLVEFFNRTCPYKTPEMLQDPRIRHGIEGVPIIVFQEHPSTGVIEFLGKYNFNLPKRAPEPLGYSGDMESWECCENEPLDKFQTDYFDPTIVEENGESIPRWLKFWEPRFPSSDFRDLSQIQEFVSWVYSTDRQQPTNKALPSSVTYILDELLANKLKEEDENDTSFTVTGEGSQRTCTFTKDTKAYRLAKFKAELHEIVEVQSAYFYYLFTDLFLMIDSRAKNMFIGFKGSKVTKSGSKIKRKVVFEPYDMDTAIGTNNSGVLVFGYSLEDTDLTSLVEGGIERKAFVFNAQDSVFWINLRDSCPLELAAMYRSLRSSSAWSYDAIIDLFTTHQSRWPEAIFNEDAQMKYLYPLRNAVTWDEDHKRYVKTSDYLRMLQGSKDLQRKWWIWNRIRFEDGKYNTGDAQATSHIISFRGFGYSDLYLKPVIDVYVSCSFGGNNWETQRTTANNAVKFSYTPSKDPDNPTGSYQAKATEKEIWIGSSDLITDVGDLIDFYPNEIRFANATKLKRLKVGDAVKVNNNLTELDVSNSTELEEIDGRNCVNLKAAVNLGRALKLKTVLFENSGVTGVNIAEGATVEVLHLPAVTFLDLFKLDKLRDFQIKSYSKVTRLMLGDIDSKIINPVTVLKAIPAGSQVFIQGLDLTFNTASEIDEFYTLLETMVGVSRERGSNGEWIYTEYGASRGGCRETVFGTIHINSIFGSERADFERRFPYIKIDATNTTSYLTLKTWDGSSNVREPIVCTNGVPESGVNLSQITGPARAATTEWKYTFAGWNRETDQYAADSTIFSTESLKSDVIAYQAFTRTKQTYTVTWQNSNSTNLSVSPNPQTYEYGAMPSYKGSTPVNPDSNGGPFVQFVNKSDNSKGIERVTGNVVYIASYQKRWLVTFTNDDGSVLKTEYVLNGSNANPPSTPSSVNNPGWIFDGWSNPYINITSTTTCKAKYKAPQVWYDEEISDSWDVIIANIASGNFNYKPGNYKPLDLGSEGIINMQIAGLNKDPLASGGGNAATTWIAKELLATSHNMNSSSTTAGGWAASAMRAWLRGTVKPLIPSNVRNAIKEVTKYSSHYQNGAVVKDVISTDDVWIPSHKEIFNSTTYETLAPSYDDGYKDANSRKKGKVGSSSAGWWLRSAFSSATFRFVGSDGGNSIDIANGSFGAALGFCI